MKIANYKGIDFGFDGIDQLPENCQYIKVKVSGITVLLSSYPYLSNNKQPLELASWALRQKKQKLCIEQSLKGQHHPVNLFLFKNY